MRRLFASLLILFAGLFSLAQTPDHSHPASAPAQPLSALEMSSAGCPVGFFASRQVPMVSTENIGDPGQGGSSQGLHLILNHLNKPAIKSIEVTVYGTSLKARALPVGPQADDTVSKTFELHRTTGSTSLGEADVWMQQVGSLSWVDLISVAYVDGTTWHATGNFMCRAVPSNFLLVGSR